MNHEQFMEEQEPGQLCTPTKMHGKSLIIVVE